MKFIKFLFIFFTLNFLNTAFATDVCPSPDVIREKGNQFVLGYLSEANDLALWTIVSKPFEWQGRDWQTLFVFEYGTRDPVAAIDIGQEMFKSSALRTQPGSTTTGSQVSCSYSPSGAAYIVNVNSPVNYGVRK